MALEKTAPETAELVGTTRNPVPNGAVTGAFNARGGLHIRYARWDTTAERCLGTVCLFHGRAEFIEKYFETITDLRRRGFAVATMDWRGQGGSSRLLRNPAKGHVKSFSQFDGDVRQFMDEIVRPNCPAPYYCLAHSMGGHIALRLAQTKDCLWDRLVLSAPQIALTGKEPQKSRIRTAARAAALAGFGSRFIPGGKPYSPDEVSFEGNPVTSDRLRYERAQEVLRAAPQLAIGSPTIAWVAAACSSIAVINAPLFMASVKVPLLIIAASNDKFVCTASIEDYASRLKNCAHIVIAGAKHEILQERDQFREQFWAAFDAFVPGSATPIMPERSEQSEVVR